MNKLQFEHKHQKQALKLFQAIYELCPNQDIVITQSNERFNVAIDHYDFGISIWDIEDISFHEYLEKRLNEAMSNIAPTMQDNFINIPVKPVKLFDPKELLRVINI